MFTTQLLDVMTTAGVLYIVALGLLIVYGVLKIINLAHGAFLAMGAYAGVIIVDTPARAMPRSR